MKNKLLHITRRAIPYIRELRPIAGSVTATLLWQQLDYWFAQQPNGFYKFLESCQHAAYKEGDSWTEELAFTKEEFRTAFKKIGIVYKSKKDYDKAQNKFVNDVGKAFYFCSYHDKIKGLTWYFRNHQHTDKALDSLIKQDDSPVNRESRFTEIGNPDLQKTDQALDSLIKQGDSPVNRESRFTEIGNPDLRRLGIPIYGDWESRSPLYRDDYTEITLQQTTTNIRPTENFESDLQKAGKVVVGRILNGMGNKKTTNSLVTVGSDPVSSGLVFDFALQEWTNAQRQLAIKLLNSVPKSDNQMLLDEFNSAVAKGTVKQIWRYLNTLIRKYQQGEFTPTSDLPEKRVNAVKKVNKQPIKRISTSECPYCNERGSVKFVKRSGRFERFPCSHDSVKIEAIALEKKAYIEVERNGRFERVPFYSHNSFDEVPF